MFFNRVFIAGNLTRNPDVRYMSNGVVVCKIGVAVNRVRKSVKETLFVDVIAFGKIGELIGEYFVKGMNIFIEGRLKQETWESDGVKKSKLVVYAENVKFGNNKKEAPKEIEEAEKEEIDETNN